MNRFILTRIRTATCFNLNYIIKSTSNHSHLPTFKFSPSLSLSSSSTPQTSKDSDSSPPPLDDDVPTDVTTQELKDRIDRYVKGDMEALPSIFEAILARKLSGKHEDTDDELMEELRSKTPQGDDQVFQSDEDSDEDLTESDDELSD